MIKLTFISEYFLSIFKFRKMSNKKLKVMYSCTYVTIICLLAFLSIATYHVHASSQQNFGPALSVEQMVNTTNATLPKTDEYINKIIIARLNQKDMNFSFYDAVSLLDKIVKYSDMHDISLESALLIVHVESDFNPNAYNKRGKAYGLCQITNVCLDEYNWMHNTSYTLEDMYNPDLNLDVGFWYYNRIMTHYSDYYGYITTRTEELQLRDAYLCYNVGVTMFNKIGRKGRNALRTGTYPCNMYGAKKGETYLPIGRYKELAKIWS